MMRLGQSSAVLALVLAACAPQSPPEPARVMRYASAQAMRDLPRAAPTDLPPLQPPTLLQSQLEALSVAQTAEWILPADLARSIVARDLLRGMLPRIGGISLYTAPQRTAYAGVCRLSGYDVWLRVPNESTLSEQQHLDPPLQPYQRQAIFRWKVVGSTLASNSRPDCASATPLRNWFEGPSAAFIHRAMNLVEQAQRSLIRPRLECQQMRYEEARQEFGYPRCKDAAALLAQLTPKLIRRVRPADCTRSTEPRGCIGIEYDDPAGPGTHSIYVVTIPDRDPPAYIEITQMMLPPH